MSESGSAAAKARRRGGDPARQRQGSEAVHPRRDRHHLEGDGDAGAVTEGNIATRIAHRAKADRDLRYGLERN